MSKEPKYKFGKGRDGLPRIYAGKEVVCQFGEGIDESRELLKNWKVHGLEIVTALNESEALNDCARAAAYAIQAIEVVARLGHCAEGGEQNGNRIHCMEAERILKKAVAKLEAIRFPPTIKEHSIVELLADWPKYKLKKGDVGAVIAMDTARMILTIEFRREPEPIICELTPLAIKLKS